jgi:hypothetical protein
MNGRSGCFLLIPLATIGHGMSGGLVFSFFLRRLFIASVLVIYYHRGRLILALAFLFDGMLHAAMHARGRAFVCTTVYFNVLYRTGVSGLVGTPNPFQFPSTR